MNNDAGQALCQVFSKIRIINLESRSDRKREMMAELRRIGLSVDGNVIDIFKAFRFEDPGNFPSIGARGCFLSHLGILKQAQAQNFASVLIFEDDLDFCQDPTEHIVKAMNELDHQEWSMFYGGYEISRPITPIPGKSIQFADSDDSIGTTHFIGIHARAIPDLVLYFEAMLTRPAGDPAGGPMHVDGAYNWFRKSHPQFKTFIALPIIGVQRPSRTDIGELKAIDKIGSIRVLIGLLRKFKRSVNRFAGGLGK